MELPTLLSSSIYRIAGKASIELVYRLVSFDEPFGLAPFRILATDFRVNLLPNGRLSLKLLKEGTTKPVIARKFPLLEAALANQLLESGQVTDNVVLTATELL